jgi:hypothetical protein
MFFPTSYFYGRLAKSIFLDLISRTSSDTKNIGVTMMSENEVEDSEILGPDEL